jgi:hypothetical protein
MRAILLFFLLICRSAPGAPSQPELGSCVGNLCLYKPLTDQQFVNRFGKGWVRIDEADRLTHYRCFYVRDSKLWAEFQFGVHGVNSPELVSVFLSRLKLCAETYTARTPLNTNLEHGKIVMGMSETDVIEQLGHPARIEMLSANARNPIFDKRFGDRAYIYEMADSVLYAVVYMHDAKLIGFRLSVEE